MKPFTSVAFSLVMFVVAAIPQPVIAQPSRVICESSSNRSNRCAIDTSRGVRINRQLSNTSCGGRWETGRGFVEVRDGCRAEFISDRGDWDGGGSGGWNGGGSSGDRGDRVTCESRDDRNNRCNINTNGRVRLVRQLSGATCYGNWNVGRGFVEVRNGCRGEFASDGGGSNGSWNGGSWNGGGWNDGGDGDRVTCESLNGRNNRCSINTNGRVRLVRQLSSTSCNRNWNVGRGYVEVRNGCRAQFASDDFNGRDTSNDERYFYQR